MVGKEKVLHFQSLESCWVFYCITCRALDGFFYDIARLVAAELPPLLQCQKKVESTPSFLTLSDPSLGKWPFLQE